MPADLDVTLHEADHDHNLATLRRLTGWCGDPGTEPMAGRAGWRLQSDDRLPLLGPVPAQWVGPRDDCAKGQPAMSAPINAEPGGTGPRAQDKHRATRPPDQARHVPRQPGLYVFTALGSRGITHAALGGELLAACITGDPAPAPASLLDALDPARFIARQARRPG
jgi:tRNA 5-methylaminomethyl-2-thiouridine biosynthesis bifunctional protein